MHPAGTVGSSDVFTATIGRTVNRVGLGIVGISGSGSVVVVGTRHALSLQPGNEPTTKRARKMDNRSYKNRNRITPRAQWWDYSKTAAYFVTICTHNRIHYFGEIQNGVMDLSPVGILADQYWYEIINHSHNVQLGAFTVMPNHIHGILIFNNNIVGTTHALSLHALSPQQQPGKNRFQNQGKNTLSSIVGSYESAVSKHAHRLNFEFEWQGRFYDNIIRDKESFYRIERYILNNVKNWKSDGFHRTNIK